MRLSTYPNNCLFDLVILFFQVSEEFQKGHYFAQPYFYAPWIASSHLFYNQDKCLNSVHHYYPLKYLLKAWVINHENSFER